MLYAYNVVFYIYLAVSQSSSYYWLPVYLAVSHSSIYYWLPVWLALSHSSSVRSDARRDVFYWTTMVKDHSLHSSDTLQNIFGACQIYGLSWTCGYFKEWSHLFVYLWNYSHRTCMSIVPIVILLCIFYLLYTFKQPVVSIFPFVAHSMSPTL